jgi:SAM-dependent methyltransferase
MEYVKCDLCGSNNYALLLQTRDYRFGLDEIFNVVKCNSCGLLYLNPRPTAESIINLYKEVYAKNDVTISPLMEFNRWKVIVKRIWHRISGQYFQDIINEAKGRVLDIGCGYGHYLLALKQKGIEVYGLEVNPICVEVCNQAGLNVFCGTLEKANFSSEFFDVIILSQVIEHTSSPKETLTEIYRILKPGGKVLIYCPSADSFFLRIFGKYWQGWYAPFHFYTFNPFTLKKLSEAVGFKIEEIRTITPDNFFIVSLKSCLWGERKIRPIYEGKFFNSRFFRIAISPILRLLDAILSQNGDCLKARLVKI